MLPVVFDEAVDYSRIDLAKVAALAVVTRLPEPLPLEISDDAVEQATSLDFYLNGLRLSDEFMVTKTPNERVIIGAFTMRKWKIELDFDNDQIATDPLAARRILY